MTDWKMEIKKENTKFYVNEKLVTNWVMDVEIIAVTKSKQSKKKLGK